MGVRRINNTKKNLPKFHEFDDLVFTLENAKNAFKKKYKYKNPVETGVQNCHEIGVSAFKNLIETF